MASFGNQITPLLVDYFGTDLDMARYSIANGLLATFRAFLYAPYAVLLPNITSLFSRGEMNELKKRFEDSNRILIPTLIFAFIGTLSFGEYLLGSIYGIRALDQTGGLSALQFMTAMAPGLAIVPLSGIYGNVLTALDKMKGLLIIGALNVAIQTIWIVALQPFIGVIAMALIWILAIPIFIVYHYYTRRTTSLTIGRGLLMRGVLLTLVATPIALGFSFIAGLFGDWISIMLDFVPFIGTTTFGSLIKLLFLAPFWYVYLSVCLATGVMRTKDIDNLKKFLMKIPPLWWVSKPLIGYVEKFENRRTHKKNENPINSVSGTSV
jgi:O-antigen/teichoic acid export membrane protein